MTEGPSMGLPPSGAPCQRPLMEHAQCHGIGVAMRGLREGAGAVGCWAVGGGWWPSASHPPCTPLAPPHAIVIVVVVVVVVAWLLYAAGCMWLAASCPVVFAGELVQVVRLGAPTSVMAYPLGLSICSGWPPAEPPWCVSDLI